jgi:hypothetical protein
MVSVRAKRAFDYVRAQGYFECAKQVIDYARSAALSSDYAESASFFVVRFDSARFGFSFTKKKRFRFSPSAASQSAMPNRPRLRRCPCLLPFLLLWCPFKLELELELIDSLRPTIASQNFKVHLVKVWHVERIEH